MNSNNIICSAQVAHTAMEDKTRGRVRLSFSYSMEKQIFSVYVDKADRLVPDSTKGYCDPYVKWCVGGEGGRGREGREREKENKREGGGREKLYNII